MGLWAAKLLGKERAVPPDTGAPPKAASTTPGPATISDDQDEGDSDGELNEEEKAARALRAGKEDEGPELQPTKSSFGEHGQHLQRSHGRSASGHHPAFRPASWEGEREYLPSRDSEKPEVRSKPLRLRPITTPSTWRTWPESSAMSPLSRGTVRVSGQSSITLNSFAAAQSYTTADSEDNDEPRQGAPPVDRLERQGVTWTTEEVADCITMEQFLDYLEARAAEQGGTAPTSAQPQLRRLLALRPLSPEAQEPWRVIRSMRKARLQQKPRVPHLRRQRRKNCSTELPRPLREQVPLHRLLPPLPGGQKLLLVPLPPTNTSRHSAVGRYFL